MAETRGRGLPPGDDAAALVAVSWPVAAGLGSFVLIHVVDLFWLGRLGPGALAAAAVGGALLFVVFTLTGVARVGGTTLVAQAHGRGDEEGEHRAARDAVVVGAGLGCAVTVAALLGLSSLVGLLGLEGTTALQTEEYCRLLLLAAPALFIGEACLGWLVGSGRTGALAAVVLGANGLNLVLDPLLIFGLGPLPGLGLQGAALASLLAAAASGVAYLVLFGRARKGHGGSGGGRAAGIRRVVAIGLPVAGREIARPLAGLVICRFVAPFGAPAVAALGVAQRYVALMGIYVGAISVGLAALAGARIGAGRVEAVPRLVATGFRVGLPLHLVQAVLMTVAAEGFLGLFDATGTVVALGAPLIRILAWSTLFVLATHVWSAPFKGSGRTAPLLLAAVVGYWLVQVPAVAAAAAWTSLSGVWVVLGLSVGVETLLVGGWYRRGGWRTGGA